MVRKKEKVDSEIGRCKYRGCKGIQISRIHHVSEWRTCRRKFFRDRGVGEEGHIDYEEFEKRDRGRQVIDE